MATAPDIKVIPAVLFFYSFSLSLLLWVQRKIVSKLSTSISFLRLKFWIFFDSDQREINLGQTQNAEGKEKREIEIEIEIERGRERERDKGYEEN